MKDAEEATGALQVSSIHSYCFYSFSCLQVAVMEIETVKGRGEEGVADLEVPCLATWVAVITMPAQELLSELGSLLHPNHYILVSRSGPI